MRGGNRQERLQRRRKRKEWKQHTKTESKQHYKVSPVQLDTHRAVRVQVKKSDVYSVCALVHMLGMDTLLVAPSVASFITYNGKPSHFRSFPFLWPHVNYQVLWLLITVLAWFLPKQPETSPMDTRWLDSIGEAWQSWGEQMVSRRRWAKAALCCLPLQVLAPVVSSEELYEVLRTPDHHCCPYPIRILTLSGCT